MEKINPNEPKERAPKNFRLVSPECCLTCRRSFGDEILQCEVNYGNRTWGGGDRTGVLKKGDVVKMNWGINPLGFCDEYERKPTD